MKFVIQLPERISFCQQLGPNGAAAGPMSPVGPNGANGAQIDQNTPIGLSAPGPYPNGAKLEPNDPNRHHGTKWAHGPKWAQMDPNGAAVGPMSPVGPNGPNGAQIGQNRSVGLTAPGPYPNGAKLGPNDPNGHNGTKWAQGPKWAQWAQTGLNVQGQGH